MSAVPPSGSAAPASSVPTSRPSSDAQAQPSHAHGTARSGPPEAAALDPLGSKAPPVLPDESSRASGGNFGGNLEGGVRPEPGLLMDEGAGMLNSHVMSWHAEGWNRLAGGFGGCVVCDEWRRGLGLADMG